MDREGQGCQLGKQSSPAVSASDDKVAAVLPVQQPSAPSHFPPTGLSSWGLWQVIGQDAQALGVGVGHRVSKVLFGTWLVFEKA